MLPKTDWAHLIPHAQGMCLLDGVLDWDGSHIHAVSEGHCDPAHPLRGEHGLHAVHLCEYGAQAMAVHGALGARERGIEEARPGVLVSLREVELACEYVPGHGRLDVHAECLHAGEVGAQYRFEVRLDGRVLASGRAAVIHPEGT